MSEENEDKKQMSDKEIKDFLAKKVKFYDQQIPVLEKELAYQELLTKIEKLRTEQLLHVAQQGQLLSTPDDSNEEEHDQDILEPNHPRQPKRTLKT